MLTKYSSKLIPMWEPTMVLGESPIKVVAPPILEAITSAITMGRGLTTIDKHHGLIERQDDQIVLEESPDVGDQEYSNGTQQR